LKLFLPVRDVTIDLKKITINLGQGIVAWTLAPPGAGE